MEWLISAPAIGVALLVDRWWGEPPVTWHPVVWMGRYLQWAGALVQRIARPAPAQHQPPVRDWRAGVLGALAWCVGAALVVALAQALQMLVLIPMPMPMPMPMSVLMWGVKAVLTGLLLKPLLAWALLAHEVRAVENALNPASGGSLAQGRERLRWLVSRDAQALSATQVRESAIETLAENLNDSVVAPIFWFAVLGLPGAALYRFANTADAMWGYPGIYQGQNWAWAGKWAARADDVLSWLPARLTALGLLLLGARQWRPLMRLRQQANSTPSPNSGWPMAAMALALDVALHKPGVYVLNPQGRAPAPADTQRALVIAGSTVWLGAGAWLLVLPWWR